MTTAIGGLLHRAAGTFHFSDPYHIYIRRALRLAVMFPTAMVVLSQVLHLPQVSVLYGLFGCFSLTTMCDFGGPYFTRTMAYLATIGMGWVSITIASAASFSGWAAIAATLGYGFLVTYSGVLRGYFAAAVPGVFVGFFLAISTPHDWTQLGPNLVGWTVGAGLAAVGGLLLWPMHTRDLLRHRIADAFDAHADVIEVTWVDNEGPVATWERAHRELVAAVAAVRAGYVGMLRRPGTATGRERYLSQLVMVVGDLASSLERVRPEKAHDLPGDRELAISTISALRDAAAVCRVRRPRSMGKFPDIEQLNRERERHLSQVEKWIADSLGTEPAQRVVVRVRHDMILRRVSGLALMAIANLRGSVGRDPIHAGMGTFAGHELMVRLPKASAGRDLLMNLTPQSVWFRNSARAAVAYALAVAVILITGLDHGFWIALGVMVALQSDATGSRSSVQRVLIGTVIGLVVGEALVWLGQGSPIFLWILLAVAVALATYAPGASTPVAGQAAFTTFLLVLFALLLPGEERVTAAARFIDVLAALAVTLVASMALWPRGAAALVSRSLAESTFATGAYVVTAFRRLRAGPGGLIAAEVTEADRRARMAYERAAENFDLATSQRVPNGIPAPVWSLAANSIVEALLEVDKVRFMAEQLELHDLFPHAVAQIEFQANRISAAWMEAICASCDVRINDYIPDYEPIGQELHGSTAGLNRDAAHALEGLLSDDHPNLSPDEAVRAVALIVAVAALSVMEHSGTQVARFAKQEAGGRRQEGRVLRPS